MRYSLPFLLTFALSGIVSAANFEVTNLLDSGAGSLRAAVSAADAAAGPDTITFSIAAGELIELTSGPLTLANPGLLTVTAAGLADRVTISAFGASRLFEIATGAELALVNLIISDGLAPGGGNGTDGPAPTDGGAGGDGGAIHCEGALTLRNCIVESNSAGDGGAGGEKTGAADAPSGSGGAGGRGGAIYCGSNATLLRVEDTTLRLSNAGRGGVAGDLATGAGGSIGLAGKGGAGGVVYCEGAALDVIRSVVESNSAGSGGSGGGNGDGGVGGPGGDGGDGGGLVANGSEFFVIDSIIRSNSAGDGGLGGNAFAITEDTLGAGGNGGDGGGIWVSEIDAATTGAHVSRSIIRNNSAGRGRDGGDASDPGTGDDGTDGGDGGNGGGVFVASMSGIVWEMENSTVISNFAGDGGFGGEGPTGGSGGAGGDAGNGGGIAFSRDGFDYSAELTHLTIYLNEAGLHGSEGFPSGADAGATSSGGGIWEIPGGIVTNGGISLLNCVVAVNEADEDVNVNFSSEGTNFTSGDPQVGVLSDNGGPTSTLPPVLGSPLIDGGAILAEPLSTDQRGAARPFNGLPDLGAFEVSFRPDARIGANGNVATHRIDNYYTASGAKQIRVLRLRGSRTSRFFVSVQNDGDIADNLRLSGTRANRSLRLTARKLTGGAANITGRLTAGYVFTSVPVGEVFLVRFDVKARSKKVRARQNLRYSVRSSADGLVDTVLAKVIQRRSR